MALKSEAAKERHRIQQRDSLRRRRIEDPEWAARRRQQQKNWVAQNKDRQKSWPSKSKEYRRRKKLKERYGITIEQYDSMLAQQGGKCAICGTDKTDGQGRFHIDHNHETGSVRSLLCLSCNAGLGHFSDSAALLKAAADYLERWNNRCS